MDDQLREALSKPFGREAIRQKRGQGGRTMDYVSHGMVTKRLNDVAHDWSATMIERYVQHIDGTLHCLGGVMQLTIGDVTHEEAGGPARLTTLADDLKNTYSDCLKRCAMRFGVALDLWESAEENDEDALTEPPAPQERGPAPSRPAPRQEPRPLRPSAAAASLPVTAEQIAAVEDTLAQQAERETPEGALAWLATAQNRTEQHEAHRRCRAFAEQGIISKADVAKAFNESADRLRQPA